MNNLIISTFRNESQAERAWRELLARDSNGALGLEDAVTMEKTQTGKIRFHHLSHFTLGGAVGGAFLGAVIGMLLLNPVFVAAGVLVGLITGMVFGLSSYIGIDPDTLGSQALNLDPGQAALCVQPGGKPDRIAQEIDKVIGKTVQTRICTLGEEEDLQCRPWGALGTRMAY